MSMKCRDVRRRLEKIQKHGLPVGTAIELHLAACPACASHVKALALIGPALRFAIDDALDSLQALDMTAIRIRARGLASHGIADLLRYTGRRARHLIIAGALAASVLLVVGLSSRAYVLGYEREALVRGVERRVNVLFPEAAAVDSHELASLREWLEPEPAGKEGPLSE